MPPQFRCRFLPSLRSCASAPAIVLLLAFGSFAQQTPSAQTGSTAGTSHPQSSAKDQNQKPAPPSDSTTTKIHITVTDPSDKPVSNASVYVRYNESGGLFHKDHLAEMSYKTNQEGSLKVPEVPKGKVLIQVIAKGWHTYGKWYDLNKDDETVAIKLEPPPHWY